jgi:hypothetical protein
MNEFTGENPDECKQWKNPSILPVTFEDIQTHSGAKTYVYYLCGKAYFS